MYIPQPEEYYNEVADIACQVFEIPLCERDAIFCKKSVRQKEKISKKYNIKKRVTYKTIYVNKHQDKISKAKLFFHYYLWNKNIKSPNPGKSSHSFIFSAKEKIESCQDMQYLYSLFISLAENVVVKPYKKRTVIEFAC